MSIPCNTILYRVILKRGWFDPDDESSVKPEAFFRRAPTEKDGEHNPRDENGLSLFREDRVSAKESMAAFNRCYGVVSLHVGSLLDLGLRIVLDEENLDKVLIENLPYENPGTAVAERLAGDVAESARIVVRNR